jgi:hypothetical protein
MDILFFLDSRDNPHGLLLAEEPDLFFTHGAHLQRKEASWGTHSPLANTFARKSRRLDNGP